MKNEEPLAKPMYNKECIFTTIRMASLPLGGVGEGAWGLTEPLEGIVRSKFVDWLNRSFELAYAELKVLHDRALLDIIRWTVTSSQNISVIAI